MTVETGKGWTMHLGDCVEVMAGLEKVDHVITDPPYDEHTHKNAATKADCTRDHRGVAFASLPSAPETAARIVLAARRWAIAFCTMEHVGAYRDGAGKAWVRAGVWDKINPAPQISGDRPAQAVEAIAIMHAKGRKRWNRAGGAGIWRCMAPRGDDRPDHPTPKPVPLMLALVADFTDPGETVLDPFAGSGTTGVACVRLGRRFIGIELDPVHFSTACDRLRDEERLFDEVHGHAPVAIGAPADPRQADLFGRTGT